MIADLNSRALLSYPQIRIRRYLIGIVEACGTEGRILSGYGSIDGPQRSGIGFRLGDGIEFPNAAVKYWGILLILFAANYYFLHYHCLQ